VSSHNSSEKPELPPQDRELAVGRAENDHLLLACSASAGGGLAVQPRLGPAPSLQKRLTLAKVLSTGTGPWACGGTPAQPAWEGSAQPQTWAVLDFFFF